MTREEAIVQIESLKNYCEYMADGDESGAYVYDLDEQALDLALAALRPVSRERVEKVWKGAWKYSHTSATDHFAVVKCSKCGHEAYAMALHVIEGNFCPACGAPMTDEAVQMVMERMEALKDGSTTN